MNLLYFLNYYPTKHKLVAHDEMLEMARRRHHITVVAVWGGEKDKSGELPFKVIYLKNKILFLNIIRLMFGYGRQLFSHFRLVRQYLGFADALKFISSYQVLKNSYPDRIHAHFANNAALKGYLLSKFLDVSFSCTGHGSEILLYPEIYLKELIFNAQPFITISQYNKKFLEDKYNIPTNIIKVNYAGIYLENFKPETLKKTSSIFKIISVTALREIKGVKYLIEACKILKNDNFNFQCNIIGGGELFEILTNQINKSGLENEVFLLGIINNEYLIKYYNKCNVFILPSLSESMGVVNMEALACELPVIATDVRGVSELIIDGYTGYLVPPADSQSIAEKIKFCYNNPNTVKQLGINGRKHIMETFNIKKNVGRFEQLIAHS